MIATTEVIVQSQLNKIDATHATVTLRNVGSYRRPGNAPAQAGDVLSIQPYGFIEARPRGTAGAYEVAEILPNGNLLYTPTEDSPGYIVLGGGLK